MKNSPYENGEKNTNIIRHLIQLRKIYHVLT
jgi:hypothetical protein